MTRGDPTSNDPPGWTRSLFVVAVLVLVASAGMHVAGHLGFGVERGVQVLLMVATMFIFMLAIYVLPEEMPRRLRLRELAVPRWARVGVVLLTLYGVGQVLSCGEEKPYQPELRPRRQQAAFELRRLSGGMMILDGWAVVILMRRLDHRVFSLGHRLHGSRRRREPHHFCPRGLAPCGRRGLARHPVGGPEAAAPDGRGRTSEPSLGRVIVHR